ncbi:family 10 glycosylhydrolase [Paenibacillus donghaensis]|uniref:family 10 glycosylhydrolase n=1 Tax=Paenibacillus donghaensis TaxID=414771 RepID=UPI0018831A5F|nr:family 10 glycosylhydrolase [Paenibacillus donghaensis]MBE9913035.1 family 10 glycosylhydrolase [Paenibacillus donghaensis]
MRYWKFQKWMILALVLILLLPVTGRSVQAQSTKRSISITLDGNSIKSDVSPYIIPGVDVTMVPLAVISQGLGAFVNWNHTEKTVVIQQNGSMMSLTKGKKTALVNGSNVDLDASVEIKNGRTMVPLRFVGENLGLQVNWNQAEQSIVMYSGQYIPNRPDPVEPNQPNQPNQPQQPSPGQGNGQQTQGLHGAWISTVANLDWPTTKSVGKEEQQKQEFTAMLDKLQTIGINAVYVQVRPAGDAFYPSQLVPWSKYLTGTQGKEPGYDPLQFMIDEAHKRGMQFHAWFNPFRASMDTATSKLAANHVAIEHPDWIVPANNQLIINPGIPEARQHIIDVVMEVVNKYNIDGVHLDDYFYPTSGTFNDDATYKTYNSSGLSKDNWRRDNINRFVQQLGQSIHAAKPSAQFGISPFGVWRNKANDSTGSDTKAGITAYDSYFADVRTWIQNHWIDYIAPQIYWSMSFKNAQYDKLVDWWVNEVKGTGVNLYIGQAAYKLGTSEAGWQSSQEIINQLQYNTQYPEVKGNIFFRAGNLINNPLGLVQALAAYYQQ